jgi:C4-dicarboxylate transporter/malic acid transport protein
MTSTTLPAPPPLVGPTRSLAGFGPNWFATVMGTGIVAVAGATLPVEVPGLRDAARAVWTLDLVLLAVLLVAAALHRVRHTEAARAHLDDPAMAHFYGAPAMALLTVGAGSVLLGQPLLGTTVALGLAVVLWSVGTVLGLVTAVAVPFRAFTTHRVGLDAAYGAWLMPVVPPMVSAATGPLLVGRLPAGDLRLTLHLACLMMFGLSLVAALMITTTIWSRLMHHQVGAAAAVPTLWIVLGPLGQSVTAARALATTAEDSLPAPYGSAVAVIDVLYGAPMWGFAMLWLALAAALTVHTVRHAPGGLPFTLGWWSFTFPVGTVVTATSGLAAATGAPVLVGAAVVGYVVLVAAWLVVATRTVRAVAAGMLLGGLDPKG